MAIPRQNHEMFRQLDFNLKTEKLNFIHDSPHLYEKKNNISPAIQGETMRNTGVSPRNYTIKIRFESLDKKILKGLLNHTDGEFRGK